MVGLRQLREACSADPDTGEVFLHTLFYIVGYLPLVYVGGLALALALNKRLDGRSFWRGIYFLPVVTSWIVVALVWRWLLNPSTGVVNTALAFVRHRRPRLVDRSGLGDAVDHPRVGVEGPRLRDGDPARGSAGDRTRTSIDAANVDGAGRWRRLVSVTLPLLSPSTFFVVVISLINGFQVFDQVYAMTGGGPGGAARSSCSRSTT